MRSIDGVRQLYAAGLVLMLSGLSACSTSSSSSATPDGGDDDTGAPDAGCDTSYKCGNACVPGNSKGVGHFCDHVTDCLDQTEAHLCSTLGDSTEHFCTFVCHDPDAGADGGTGTSNECGENASCQCSGGQCGCFPDSCK